MSLSELVIAGGCFWGMEELFRSQIGVMTTEVGYTGGKNANPTYSNHLEHAEAIKIVYDSEITSIQSLLDYFFKIHDPTTVNRQGNDLGSSYRSAIFVSNHEQKEIAEESIRRNQINWPDKIVTNIEPLTTFWSAENYHQDYLQKNPGGYTCHYER